MAPAPIEAIVGPYAASIAAPASISEPGKVVRLYQPFMDLIYLAAVIPLIWC